MAFDPSTPADVKRRLKALPGAAYGVGIDAPFPASNDVFAPDVQAASSGVNTTSAIVPRTQTSIASRAARGLVNFAADPGGIVADNAARRGVQAGVATHYDPAAPAPPVDAATEGLPEGVRRTVAQGIYEGRRGLAGERVFSDNQYDPLLTVRSGAGVGLRATDPAAQAALNRTPGTASAQPLPAMTPKYQFASADPVAAAQRARGLMANPAGAAALDETDAALRERLGTTDPAVLAREIATNKAALAETRYARGAGANSATGETMAQGGNVGLTATDIISAQNAEANIRQGQARTELDISKERNERAQKTYDSFFEGAKEMTPQQRRGLSAQDYATIAVADRAEATPEQRANADAALERQLVKAFNTTEGGLVDALKNIPGLGGIGPNFTPDDIGGQAIGFDRSEKNLTFATDVNGNALTPEEAAEREQAGLPIRRVTAGADPYGFVNDRARSFLDDPVLGTAARNYIKRRQAKKRKTEKDK